MSETVRILFLAADPSDRPRLRLGKEFQVIQDELARGKRPERFQVESLFSVKVEDMTRKIHDFRPHVIHFSGHGSKKGELCFEEENGHAQNVAPEDLERFFALLKGEVDCVILNACYSRAQAEAITKYVPFVVGLAGTVADQAAIHFSQGFYQALRSGRTIAVAFESGCALAGAKAGVGLDAATLLAWPDADERSRGAWDEIAVPARAGCVVVVAIVIVGCLSLVGLLGTLLVAREFTKGWDIQVGPEARETILVPIEPHLEFSSRPRPPGNLVVEEPTITLAERGLGIRGRVVPLAGGDLAGFWVKAVLVDGDRTFEQFSMIDQRTESWSVFFDLHRNLIPGERLTLKATLLEDGDREIQEINRGISIESRGTPP